MFVVQVSSSCAVLVVLAVCVGWSQEQDYEPLYLGTFANTAHRVSNRAANEPSAKFSQKQIS